ncbi:hypothetical protein EVAR_83027_1 [Eumeta japonica]|uniref:Uncharacterized protein n=1 Tax=Eumeta variegata TaxID=151549 RepID=A0A4C1VNB4_EUMVA|nr:hypothetical protein EVAR_83027_1 [Eumeta japonica]
MVLMIFLENETITEIRGRNEVEKLPIVNGVRDGACIEVLHFFARPAGRVGLILIVVDESRCSILDEVYIQKMTLRCPDPEKRRENGGSFEANLLSINQRNKKLSQEPEAWTIFNQTGFPGDDPGRNT